MGLLSTLRKRLRPSEAQADNPVSGYVPWKTTMQELTDLLIDNGCTINKPAMAALTSWIGERDKQLIQDFQRQLKKLDDRLEQAIKNQGAQLGVSDLQLNGSDSKKKGNSKAQS